MAHNILGRAKVLFKKHIKYMKWSCFKNEVMSQVKITFSISVHQVKQVCKIFQKGIYQKWLNNLTFSFGLWYSVVSKLHLPQSYLMVLIVEGAAILRSWLYHYISPSLRWWSIYSFHLKTLAGNLKLDLPYFNTKTI